MDKEMKRAIKPARPRHYFESEEQAIEFAKKILQKHSDIECVLKKENGEYIVFDSLDSQLNPPSHSDT